MTSDDILGLVLAGGGSRRMGRDKARLPWTGTTLVERAVTVLGEVFAEVLVAGPPGLTRSGVEAVPDAYPGRGPLAGLHAGLERAGGRAVFALACDLPLVPAALVRHLVAVAGEGSGGAWVAAADGDVQPLCGLYSAACREAVARRLKGGRLSMRGLLRAIDATVVPITPGLPFYHRELLLNLNRPADLERARLAGRSGAPR